MISGLNATPFCMILYMPTYHVPVRSSSKEWTWEQESKESFNELILSWNGFRPAVGFWRFSISLFQNEWSPWMSYAEWGKNRQKTFQTDTSFAKTYQDMAGPKTGHCTAFRIQVYAYEGADLTSLHSITAALSNTSSFAPAPPPSSLISTRLSWVPRKSQMLLAHPRCKDLCSPTSTSAAIHYLSNQQNIDPILFAEMVRDQQFDIYGNWVLNTAAAYEALQGKHPTHVARLSCFSEAHAQIGKGLPVVLSLKGPLEEAPQPYASGHLILLTGYDSEKQRVLCMDPGFPKHEQTEASYALEPFLEAWGRRRNLAYLFG